MRQGSCTVAVPCDDNTKGPEMKRAMAVVAVAALSLVGATSTAGAAGSPVTHSRSNMASAQADWYRESGDQFWASGVWAGRSLTGSDLELHLWQTVGTMGGVSTSVSADATAGFSFAIDAKRLSGASLTATDLPATLCTFDENGEQVGACSDTTVDVDVSWTGEGGITSGSYTEHVRSGTSMMRVHVQWTDREARATGSLNGPLSEADLQYASLHTEKQVKMGR